MHETSIRFYDENAIIQTSGGELPGTLDDYGIGIGDFCFYGLTGKQMEQLCCLIHALMGIVSKSLKQAN